MRLLRDGRPVSAEPMQRLDDENAFPDDGSRFAVSLQRYLALERPERRQVHGVVIAPDDDPTSLGQALVQLDLLVIDFPVFTDGRGYSHARTLRRLGFQGELRATGDIRLDEIRFLWQVGIDAAELPSVIDDASLGRVFGRFPGSYQSGYRQDARPA